MRSAVALALLVLHLCLPAAAQPSDSAYLLPVKGVISVAAADYVERGLKRAADEGASLVVITLDTPGGLVSSTRTIIQAILSSKVPVAVYVSPGGAQAASAGTYILYAAHVAAMAPATNVGAATPVSLGGVPGVPDNQPNRERNAETQPGSAERKSINDAAAWIRSLAQMRGRNADWAEKAVREAATLTADEARREQVIDVVARDVSDLLAQLDGRKVVAAGTERVLATRNLKTVSIEPEWRDRLLGTLTDPNVAYVLMLMGIYGLLFEFWSPGFVLPGVVGGISLLLALAALSVLPIDYAGLALILLGVALMIGEAMTAGTAVLGIGGVVSFVAGSILLFDPSGVGGIDFGVSWPVIAAAALTSAAFLIVAIGMAMRARRRVVVSGVEEMIGSRGEVIDWDGVRGRVRVMGETWNAHGSSVLSPGTPVRVRKIDGLTLEVEKEV
jgi:membrane-bound serine protease (ClpP class)